MNKLTILPLLEKYISENGATAKFAVPFLNRKNRHNVELQNWKAYKDLRKGIITIRQSGIRVKAPDYFPCLTHNPVIPIIYDQSEYRYLNVKELLSLQSFPANYQFPKNYSLTKIASLLGNSVNVETVKHFIQKSRVQPSTFESEYLRMILAWKSRIPSFVDLFAGIGGFHLALKDYSHCVLAVDINQHSQETYQLNFPNTPFLLGDINSKEIQKRIKWVGCAELLTYVAIVSLNIINKQKRKDKKINEEWKINCILINKKFLSKGVYDWCCNQRVKTWHKITISFRDLVK